MYKKHLFLLIIPFLLLSCEHRNEIKNDIYWKTRLADKTWIFDSGLGYPTHDNVVVFHSTPEPWGDNRESILHGLSTKTGKELWRLTNSDFYPMTSLAFDGPESYFYQYENIFVGADYHNNHINDREKWAYAIDIVKGKVLWLKPFDDCVKFGTTVVGKDNYVYIDYQKEPTEFTLLRFDINSGESTEVLRFTQDDTPEDIPLKFLYLYQMSQVYSDSKGDEYIAFSFNAYNSSFDLHKAFMTLIVYNLSKNEIAYTKYVNNKELVPNTDGFNGRIFFHNGKLIVGKGRVVYCFDAYEDADVIWEYVTGIYGTDNIITVTGYDNLAIVSALTDVYAFDINTGSLKYRVEDNFFSSRIADGVIYYEAGKEFIMRDVYTGKILKLISVGQNEGGSFGSALPKVVYGRVYIHSGTHAYCIKAWGVK